MRRFCFFALQTIAEEFRWGGIVGGRRQSTVEWHDQKHHCIDLTWDDSLGYIVECGRGPNKIPIYHFWHEVSTTYGRWPIPMYHWGIVVGDIMDTENSQVIEMGWAVAAGGVDIDRLPWGEHAKSANFFRNGLFGSHLGWHQVGYIKAEDSNDASDMIIEYLQKLYDTDTNPGPPVDVKGAENMQYWISKDVNYDAVNYTCQEIVKEIFYAFCNRHWGPLWFVQGQTPYDSEASDEQLETLIGRNQISQKQTWIKEI